MNKIKIVSYYEPLGDKPNWNELQLLRLWQRVWFGHGFDPIVIGFPTSINNLDSMQEKFKSYPSVNGPGFDLVCFKRWAALVHGYQFAAKDEFYVFTDYDVFPSSQGMEFRWKHENIIEFGLEASRRGKIANGEMPGGPGWIVGRRIDFEEILDWMLTYEPVPEDQVNGQPHVSDMTVLQRNRDRFLRWDWLKCYDQNQDWLQSGIVHFGNAYMRKEKPKWIEIMEALKL